MQKDWKTTKANLDPEERVLLRDLAARAAKLWPFPVIVNIGIYHSGSMYCLRVGAPKARLVGIDIRSCYRPRKELGAEFILAKSQDCYQDFESAVHLLFIDGDHHYKAVMSDLVNWGSKVVKGGTLAIHDYYEAGIVEKKYAGKPSLTHMVEVKQAVDDWRAKFSQQWEPLDRVCRTITFRRR